MKNAVYGEKKKNGLRESIWKRLVAFGIALMLSMSLINVGAYAEEKRSITTIEETHMNPLYLNGITADEEVQRSIVYSSEVTEAEVYYNSIEEAAAALREQMKQRVETIEIGLCISDMNDELMSEIMELAIEHTGVPTEGDYLAFQFHSWSGKSSWYTKDAINYITLTYDVVYYTTEEQENLVNSEIASVLEQLNLDGLTDYEKVCAIYDYICSNVSYDYDNLEDETYYLKHTAYAALLNKKAVCQGYAVLLYRMLLECGIDSRVIGGMASGENHAWNIVELEEKYYLLDATWDAGLNQLTYNCFLKCEDNFANHTPENRFTSDAFISQYPLANVDYGESDLSDVEYVEGNYKYKIIGKNTAKITSYIGTEEHVVVPSEIGGYQVVSLGHYTFSDNEFIKSITISEGISTIETQAFSRCLNLESLSLPSSLYIPTSGGMLRGGGSILYMCPKLKTITVPEENEYLTVQDGVLYSKDMTELFLYPSGDAREKIVIPEGVVIIADQACGYNYYVKEVIMPDTVVWVGYWAFESCSALEKMDISENCDGMGQFALNGTAIKTLHLPAAFEGFGFYDAGFSNLCELESITVDSNNPYLRIVDGALCSDTILFALPAKSTYTTYKIPEGITMIWDSAFDDCRNLEKVEIPDGVNYLGRYAFWQCDNLKEVVLPDGLLEIGKGAFQGCWALEEVKIPSTVSEIGENTFFGCDSLKKVELPDGITEIPDQMFSGCPKLEKLVLPSRVEKIGAQAFYDCSVVEWENGTRMEHSGGTSACESCTIASCDYCQQKHCLDKSKIETLAVRDQCNVACLYDGYTGDTYCEECGTVLKWGHAIIAKGHHTWSEEYIIEKQPTCTEDGLRVIRCVDCGEVKAGSSEYFVLGHTGGTASCSQLAVCERCHEEYGEPDTSKHGEVEIREYKAPTCMEAGFSGIKCCVDCDVILEQGEEIPALGEHIWDAGTIIEELPINGQVQKEYHCIHCQETKIEWIKAPDEDTNGDDNGNSGDDNSGDSNQDDNGDSNEDNNGGSTEETPSEIQLGDVHYDNAVDLQDAQKLLKAALGIINLNETEKKAADVDTNGEITLQDAQIVLKMALGIKV